MRTCMTPGMFAKQKTRPLPDVLRTFLCVFLLHTVFNVCCVSLQEQYQREQEKLKKEWEKAQLEVEEEERKHNEEVQTRRLTHLD